MVMDKEKNFKVSKCKKYFQTHILKFKPGNVTISVNMSTMQLHQNREATEKYMKFVLDMEKAVKKELDSKNLGHDPMKVIVFRLNAVSSWADGIDMRSNWPIEEHAELLVYWYDKGYNEAKENCESTLAVIKENPVPYIANWRAHDKYSQDNKLFELGMEELDEYYGEDPLDKMRELSNQMLELLIKENKENRKK